MFGTLIRQQARLAVSSRFTALHHRQSLRGLLAVAQKPHVFSQRAFSLSRSLQEQGHERGGYQGSRSRGPRRRDSRQNEKRSSLFVGNLPFSAGEVDIRDMFQPYGEIKRINFATDSDGRLTGYCFLEYENLEDAIAAVESAHEEPFVLFNRSLRVHYANNLTTSDADIAPNPTIFIANFPSPGNEPLLRDLMKEYEAHILRVNFMKNGEGQLTSKAFVQFTDEETATAALKAFQDFNYEGTSMKVSYARDRNPRRKIQLKMPEFDA